MVASARCLSGSFSWAVRLNRSHPLPASVQMLPPEWAPLHFWWHPIFPPITCHCPIFHFFPCVFAYLLPVSALCQGHFVWHVVLGTREVSVCQLSDWGKRKALPSQSPWPLSLAWAPPVVPPSHCVPTQSSWPHPPTRTCSTDASFLALPYPVAQLRVPAQLPRGHGAHPGVACDPPLLLRGHRLEPLSFFISHLVGFCELSTQAGLAPGGLMSSRCVPVPGQCPQSACRGSVALVMEAAMCQKPCPRRLKGERLLQAGAGRVSLTS